MGAGLLANAVCQSPHKPTDRPLSRASPLPQGFISVCRTASVFELAAFGFDGFGQGAGFVFFVAQGRLFQRCDSGQQFFAGFGHAEDVFLRFGLRFSLWL